MNCCDHIDPNAEHGDTPGTSVGSAYTCPMHPEIVQDRPGMCPQCGMNLIIKKSKIKNQKFGHSEHEHGTHDKHAGHRTSSFIQKFWIALVLSIPLFLYSEVAAKVGIQLPEFSGLSYISAVLGTILFFYCGWIFLASAYREISAKLPGMMTLIALAVTSAYLFSMYVVIRGEGMDLFWELGSLIAIMLLGHWIEMKSVQGAQGALRELAKLLPDTAERLKGNSKFETEIIPISELKIGNLVLIKPGSKVPADGVIVEGNSELDESIITGESKPVAKESENEVIAGSLNGDGSLVVKIVKIGEHTFLAGVMRLVADAQASKSRLQMLSDRAALWLTGIAIVAGAITFGSWMFVGAGIVIAIERLVAVLVITCPHALGLAIPLVASTSTTMAARNGLLVRQRMALESARTIDTVIFDKTGTLTEAKFKVMNVSSDETLLLAASVNSHSEHPIGKAIVEEARNRSLELKNVSDFKRVPGRGAEGRIDGASVFVGNKGGDDIVVERNGVLTGSISVADAIRPESKEAIRELKGMGVRIAMLTGDSEEVAKSVASELGIDEYFARVVPGDKSAKVKLLQGKGNKVAMVGDGVNDAPALTQADLGIAIGAGTNVAIESAGIILVKSDPRDIPKIIRLSRLTYRKMIQNLFWATGYNVVALPLAAGVLAYKGIILQPALAAVFMSVSTVVVAVNAVLMRRGKI